MTFPAEFNLDLGLIQITEQFRDVAAQLGCEEHFKLIDISTMYDIQQIHKTDNLTVILFVQHLVYIDSSSLYVSDCLVIVVPVVHRMTG